MQFGIQSLQRSAPAAVPVSEPDALHLLEQFGTSIRLTRDTELHAEGADAVYCYRVVSGCIRTTRLMEDGRRQVGAFMLPGDLFGFDIIGTHDMGAGAVTDTLLRRYARRMVDGLADSRPMLGRRLRVLALEQLRAAHDQIVLLGRKTATERIASFLLAMSMRQDGGKDRFLMLPMCRTDIADHLGLTVETVCRVLAALKRAQLIAIERTGIVLHSRSGLRTAASETMH